jgi:2-iminobutanoate/2-iminopropanoate deaminase
VSSSTATTRDAGRSGGGDVACWRVSHHRRPVQSDGAPAAIGAYSHGVVSNGLLFCSGQIPLDPASGELIEGGIGDQTRRCLENLTAVSEAAGTTLANAVRLTVYAVDLAGDWAEINEAYASYFGEDGAPARVAIGVAALPKGARVEIDAVVALPD